ncbi:M23 family metallopeptidase [Afifella sp. IM 167]|uniref:M23 family metallopeptidase n=1 Tax=Afifella sp. IM 167 TaxID=2033586 RepID=UPI001CC9CA9E|nr:M23 family metallopeptidase [Afifella sp. IM 167]MBZ8132551.1 peptidase M24 [Afifella sp. IM 167]
MRQYPPSARLVFWSTRISALALLAGLGAGCSADAVRLMEPVYTGSTANQRQVIASQPTPSYQPTQLASGGAVRSQPLPPPSGSYQTAYNYQGPSGGSAPTPYPQQQASAPRAYTPPEPYAPSDMPKPLGRLKVDQNGRPVQRSTQPAASAPAARPAAPRQQPVTASAGNSAGGSYTVQSGDSLWTIAHNHGLTTSELARANNLDDGAIRPGQRLVIPNGGSTQVASVDPQSNPAPQAEEPRRQEQPASYTPPSSDAGNRPAATPVSTNPAKQQPAATGFRWPVQGRIIAEFGTKPNGERNDGINLAVPEGTAVKAAEDGTVIYAGNELKSYGNLVLVRHEGGWVSAYAHNSAIEVKRGDTVRRGQIIAKSGMTGNVTSPQVHFELRKGATPVNPVEHMASA